MSIAGISAALMSTIEAIRAATRPGAAIQAEVPPNPGFGVAFDAAQQRPVGSTSASDQQDNDSPTQDQTGQQPSGGGGRFGASPAAFVAQSFGLQEASGAAVPASALAFSRGVAAYRAVAAVASPSAPSSDPEVLHDLPQLRSGYRLDLSV